LNDTSVVPLRPAHHLRDARVDRHAVERHERLGRDAEQPDAHGGDRPARRRDDRGALGRGVERRGHPGGERRPRLAGRRGLARGHPVQQRRLQHVLELARRQRHRPAPLQAHRAGGVVRQDVIGVVLVPARVDGVRAEGGRRVALAGQRAADHPLVRGAAAGQVGGEARGLGAAAFRKDVIVVGAERRLAVADEEHRGHVSA
jgi:hypothetical protein